MLYVADIKQFKKILTPKKIKRYSFFLLNNPHFFFLFTSNSFHLMIIVIQSVRFSTTSHHVYKRIQKLCTDLIFSLLPFFFSFTHSSLISLTHVVAHMKKSVLLTSQPRQYKRQERRTRWNIGWNSLELKTCTILLCKKDTKQQAEKTRHFSTTKLYEIQFNSAAVLTREMHFLKHTQLFL